MGSILPQYPRRTGQHTASRDAALSASYGDLRGGDWARFLRCTREVMGVPVTRVQE
ncbi:hypothetical protein AB0M97_13110 [Streptomyces sp. NPDC051207]|uniref:hypothetical protein n=1 Tax=Streptomyces sp. NPDC051207 TaxID=3154641 RepID=UPI0034349F25